jgi:hypothetical protein
MEAMGRILGPIDLVAAAERRAGQQLTELRTLLRERERLRAELETVQAAIDYHLDQLRACEAVTG